MCPRRIGVRCMLVGISGVAFLLRTCSMSNVCAQLTRCAPSLRRRAGRLVTSPCPDFSLEFCVSAPLRIFREQLSNAPAYRVHSRAGKARQNCSASKSTCSVSALNSRRTLSLASASHGNSNVSMLAITHNHAAGWSQMYVC